MVREVTKTDLDDSIAGIICSIGGDDTWSGCKGRYEAEKDFCE